MRRCPNYLAGMMGKYRIEVAGHQYGEFVAADSAVQYLLKRGWFHPNDKERYYELNLKAGSMEFEAKVVFVQMPQKLSDLPKEIKKR